MADIDVQVLSLASPPTQPYQIQYTPGVLVRNNGVAEAVASGYLACYLKASGVLLGQWPVLSGAINPGSSAQAVASAALDLSAVEPGTALMFIGSVSTPGDMVPANNVLSPVTVTVQAGEPPVPPGPTPHAAQHEDGGTDELVVTGLLGVLAQRQLPTNHASQHADGGIDELNVGGLHGVLADGQPIGPHHVQHQDGGEDELNVTGLSGLLASPQESLAHKTRHQNGGSDEISVAGLSGMLADHQIAARTLSARQVGCIAPEAYDDGAAAHAFHQHGGGGPLGMDRLAGPFPPNIEHTVFEAQIGAGAFEGPAALHLSVGLLIDADPDSTNSLLIKVYGYETGQSAQQQQLVSATFMGPVSDLPVVFTTDLLIFEAGSVHGHGLLACPPAAIPTITDVSTGPGMMYKENANTVRITVTLNSNANGQFRDARVAAHVPVWLRPV